MSRSRAVFQSVSQAIHVAYLIHSLPPTQKGPMQVLIELKERELGLGRPEVAGTVNFSGLTPQEIRGQCSMIRGAVEHHCTSYERAALVSWFSPVDASSPSDLRGLSRFEVESFKRKIWAMTALHAYSQPCMTIEDRLAQQDIVRAVHARGKCRDVLTERAIASGHGLSQSTVHRNVVAVAKVCAMLRRAGMDRLEPMFVRDCLVEDPVAA